MYLPNSSSGRPVYRGSQSFTISDFVFTGSNPRVGPARLAPGIAGRSRLLQQTPGGGAPAPDWLRDVDFALPRSARPIGQSETLVIAAAGVAEDMVEHDRRADDDQAGGDRAALGAGDDDPVVAT